MVTDTKPAPLDQPKVDLVLCVRCDHDTSWHYDPIEDRAHCASDEMWQRGETATYKDSGCNWSHLDEEECKCRAFKHPEAPRRREAIEHPETKL